MRVRCIAATHKFRTGPAAADWLEMLDVEDSQFQTPGEGKPVYGTIDVYLKDGPEGDRYCHIRSPRIDRQTGKPLEVFLPLERLISWEPMPEGMRARLYPEERVALQSHHDIQVERMGKRAR
jgi:hypothetical protein